MWSFLSFLCLIKIDTVKQLNPRFLLELLDDVVYLVLQVVALLDLQKKKKRREKKEKKRGKQEKTKKNRMEKKRKGRKGKQTMHKDRKKEDKEKEEIERKATSFFRFCQSFSVLSEEKTPMKEEVERNTIWQS